MADWGPVVLFVLLSPELPGPHRVVEFTSGAAIIVHSVIYFGLITIFLVAVDVHVYTG
ncbi:hypothetical protein Leryth_021237 [Lithospermum erythrorhizon]|nr:hypothetical protein Leryth_021237 [Lithospermum erythrorhizon]